MASSSPAITTVTELERFGTPEPRNRDKVLAVLEDVHVEWLAATSLVFMATASADGRCDVSPKGDPPGFVRVLAPHQLAIPDRPGNRRMDGFHNLLENPHVGLICLIPGRGDTLRINGTAHLVRDLPELDAMAIGRHRPSLALLIDVEEVFFHCPKPLRRARAWDAAAWRPDAARPYADIALALWRRDQPADEVRRHYATTVEREDLYPPAAPPTGLS